MKYLILIICMVLIQTNSYSLAIKSNITKKYKPCFIRECLEKRWNNIGFEYIYDIENAIVNRYTLNYYKMRIFYLNEEERKEFKIKIYKNKICNYRRKLISSKRLLNYILLENGNIYIVKDAYLRKFDLYYSYVNLGEKVASCGKILIQNGEIRYIDNNNPFFEINFFNFIQIIDELVGNNYKFKNCVLNDIHWDTDFFYEINIKNHKIAVSKTQTFDVYA